MQRFAKFEAKGQTALGPGLLAAIQLATKGKPGSMVIICTDGLANIGFGALDDPSSVEFYEKLAGVAKENAISVSLLTIKGEGCKVEVLGKLADETKG